MLNEYLKKAQPESFEIRKIAAPVGNTGITQDGSANFDATAVAKLRFQRMRRRLERASVSGASSIGWMARMA
jgi:hypothetical protein